jgi:hypothetical protein
MRRVRLPLRRCVGAIFRRLALLFLALPAARADGAEICPPSIQTIQTLKGPSNGWEVRDSGAKHDLISVLFFDGHPSYLRSLKYDDDREIGGLEILTWSLDAATEYWAECHYFATAVALAKPLPAGVRKCQIKYDSRIVLSIDCR